MSTRGMDTIISPIFFPVRGNLWKKQSRRSGGTVLLAGCNVGEVPHLLLAHRDDDPFANRQDHEVAGEQKISGDR